MYRRQMLFFPKHDLPYVAGAHHHEYMLPNGDAHGHEKCATSAGLPLTKSESTDGRKKLPNGMLRVHRIMTEEELAQGKEPRWTELEIRGRNLSPVLWEMRCLTALFLYRNHLTRIPCEISKLENLTVLDLSENKLRSLPAELGDMISLCHLYLNGNQIRVLPYELGKLFRLQTLDLRSNPLSPEINKIYYEAGPQKLLRFLLDHLAINATIPPDRQWVMIRHADPERPIATFTVLCYNVLCDKYATNSLYSYCPSWALNWEYRKTAILKEIRHYEADIITLQEVETEQFRCLFQPELEQIGYAGIFSPKSRAKTMGEEERKFVDGCAIFWKYDKYVNFFSSLRLNLKFELEKEHLVEFTQVAIKKAPTSEKILNRVMPKDNIALCAVFKIRENVYANRQMSMAPSDNVVGNPLVVSTAHIHWDPEFCDVKLIQSMMLVQEINTLLDEISEKCRITPQQIPVLICGDLNSLPESGVVEFLSKGAISKEHPDLKEFRQDPCITRFSASDDPTVYTHGLRLDCAVDPNSMPFTNYTLEFKGVIDYIFSTPQSLARLGVLGALNMDWVLANKIIGFPHPHVPSDHVPIMAQFAIIPTSHQRIQPVVHHYGNSHSSSFGAVGR
ncbi:CCR4-NOT transcription complex subunit 6-like family protein [Onchocerca flexuosa]|uniref:poly(A)-specific ribonuclease n=2 Tax=Onchocerca flexuosa TaxID=387005 RepID=A0A238BYF3_9BILA|nr:CCR4-NOT transcription complex subunit 6-like family protein [Onchocerca flexuosa]